MGYTHYWRRPRPDGEHYHIHSAYMFGNLAFDALKIIKQAEINGIRIRDAYGENEPEFNEAQFGINGDATAFVDGRDLAHESFIWEGIPAVSLLRKDEPETFDFCKTAHKPYDAVVTAILIRAKHIYGKYVSVSSDGEWSEWQAGRELYETVFGEVAECPFTLTTSFEQR